MARLETETYRGVQIKRRGRGKYDWFVSDAARVRWGSKDEIKQDVDFLLEHGRLPPRGTAPGGERIPSTWGYPHGANPTRGKGDQNMKWSRPLDAVVPGTTIYSDDGRWTVEFRDQTGGYIEDNSGQTSPPVQGFLLSGRRVVYDRPGALPRYVKDAVETGLFSMRPAANPSSVYEVIAGNVGTVYSGPDAEAAREKFQAYVEMSAEGFARVGGEQVTLFEDGEPVEEFVPPEPEEIENPDLVVFLEFLSKEGGGIIAVFPEQVVDERGNVNCYQHIGQHGGCNMDALLRLTSFVGVWPHQSNEVKDLWNELTDRGYRLRLHPGWYN